MMSFKIKLCEFVGCYWRKMYTVMLVELMSVEFCNQLDVNDKRKEERLYG